ncbi:MULTISPECIES: choice-of-anchor W domain-containing protein [Halorubrum]|uniref:SipW-dependent-type signal peptide-containing protein n=1 Tax=Halorubrum ezzemoulense TaxID=337243 RepID=A0A256K9D6_HALEZ|nr:MULTISPECIES: choice-of-anchor W domain-containing protein [Halorubrum]MDB2242206.1 SipW-dependent-type signal peptide-containing protein [Halorubrum ezzemoulense]MDB2261454.1 SipW-dependent-type signal peptide-containing protein [Halorubrum ezzemoulense]MDB2264422.1 SipW-dependent-type signal peptide-containing protein [Halorubrum ezzemoulense]MDB2268394.1 SipW-dependent-type signal peptide-containing protein [Halorubrum ezzemoulense]MDB2271806.1 SipW-dependent-type signal peptide-containi
MNDDKIGLSRRKMLVGLGAVGVASAGAGLGTTAYFNDTETFEDNTLTAGSLDLRVLYEASYDSDGAVENMADSAMGTQDGDPAGMFYDLDDVKPGDSGEVKFCFEIVDNPSYMWACGDLSQAENGINEPESAVDSTPDLGELGDSIMASLAYCDEDGEPLADGEIVSGSLVDVIAAISNGAALDGDGMAGLVPGEQAEYADVVEPEEGEAFITGPCVCLSWEIPTSVGNEVQSDSLTMEFEFHAVQSRHNDGTANPCEPSITTTTGEGFAKQQEFATEQETSFARGRFGGQNTWEVAVGPDVGSASTADYSWSSGSTVPFSYTYDGSANASFTLDGVNVASTIPAPSGKLGITTKADEATVAVTDLGLDLDGTPVSLSGPDAISASNDDDGSDRDVTYLVFDTDAADVANAFTISGNVTVTLQGDYDLTAEEGVAFDISVE